MDDNEKVEALDKIEAQLDLTMKLNRETERLLGPAAVSVDRDTLTTRRAVLDWVKNALVLQGTL